MGNNFLKRINSTDLLFASIPVVAFILDLLFAGGLEVSSGIHDPIWLFLPYGALFLFYALLFPPLLLVILPLILSIYIILGRIISFLVDKLIPRQYHRFATFLIFLIAVLLLAVIPTIIKGQEEREFLSISQNPDLAVSFCNGLKSKDHRVSCWESLTSGKNIDLTFCDQAVDSDSKDVCVQNVALYTHNSALCKKIKDASRLSECLQTFKNLSL